MSPAEMMPESNGVSRFFGTLEAIRGLGQDMSQYDGWLRRRGDKQFAQLRRDCMHGVLGRFVDEYANCLADSVMDLLQAGAFSVAAELAIDYAEELLGQARARLEDIRPGPLAADVLARGETVPTSEAGLLPALPLAA